MYSLRLHIKEDIIQRIKEAVEVHLVDAFAALDSLNKSVLIRRVIGKVAACAVKTAQLISMERSVDRDLPGKLVERVPGVKAAVMVNGISPELLFNRDKGHLFP